VESKFKATYEQPALIEAVRTIANICRTVEKVGCTEESNFVETMNIYSREFSYIVDCLKCFALSEDQERMIEQVKYVLRRGFREFSMLYMLKPDAVHSIKRTLIDGINFGFELLECAFLETVIQPMTSELLSTAFGKLSLLKEYDDLICDYEHRFTERKEPIFFSIQRSNLEMARAGIVLKEGRKAEALQYFCKAIKNFREIYEDVCSKDDEAVQNKYSMRLRGIVKSIIDILEGLPTRPDFDPILKALELSKHYGLTNETCVIYKLLIRNCKVPAEKVTYYAEFVSHCKEIGRVEQAICLLQEKLDFEA
jgi:tetratricopeptide (TPR) repeat protein